MSLDAQALKRSWEQVAAYGDAVPGHFYSTLFLRHPQVRDLFPVAMAGQRDKLVAALGHIVANVDNLDAAVPFLQSLGRDHRKFGVTAEHYPMVGEALLATLAHFLGSDWDEHVQQQWSGAYQLVSQVMCEAADAAAAVHPPWWLVEVTARDLRPHTEIAVLTLTPVDPPQPPSYAPGQSVAVHHPLRPRVWRWFSPANAPRGDGSIDLHVAAVAGGQLSPVLVHRTHPGDRLQLGAPVGHRLTLADAPAGKPLLLVAGGTGLSPLRALVEQVAAETAAGAPTRPVTLVHGVRRPPELYDTAALYDLSSRHPWLSLITAVSDDVDLHHPDPATAIEAALAAGRWTDHLVYVCGPPAMVHASLEQLAGAGHDPDAVHTEEFDGHIAAKGTS